jgi:hydroxyacylglutathione hydrolase
VALVQKLLKLGPLDNDTYLLVCDATRHTAVIDVGFEAEVVIDAIREHRLEVRLLLNTHAHYDHAAGMRTVQEAVGGEYWVHPADRFLLERLAAQGAAFGFANATAPGEIHDLADGQTIVLGNETLDVIHTPGHSPGGVCFRHGLSLWVGDTLFAGSIGRTDLPGGSFEDLERSIRSRLFTLADETRCFPGHGPETTIGVEKRDNPFVGERARLA